MLIRAAPDGVLPDDVAASPLRRTDRRTTPSPRPCSAPVKNRSAGVDSRSPKSCVKPSIAMGSRNSTKSHTGILGHLPLGAACQAWAASSAEHQPGQQHRAVDRNVPLADAPPSSPLRADPCHRSACSLEHVQTRRACADPLSSSCHAYRSARCPKEEDRALGQLVARRRVDLVDQGRRAGRARIHQHRREEAAAQRRRTTMMLKSASQCRGNAHREAIDRRPSTRFAPPPSGGLRPATLMSLGLGVGVYAAPAPRSQPAPAPGAAGRCRRRASATTSSRSGSRCTPE